MKREDIIKTKRDEGSKGLSDGGTERLRDEETKGLSDGVTEKGETKRRRDGGTK